MTSHRRCAAGAARCRRDGTAPPAVTVGGASSKAPPTASGGTAAHAADQPPLSLRWTKL
jgi:hypothetical protein